MRNDDKTEELVNELTLRMSDWFEDPEPQHDDFFVRCNQGHLETTYRFLKNLTRQSKQTAALFQAKRTG